MRWHIIRTLIHKECLRHLSNRGGLALSLLLIGMALILAAFGRSDGATSSLGLFRGVHHCYVDYWEDGPWIEYLKNNVPENLRTSVHFRHMTAAIVGKPSATINYPTGSCAIQLRPAEKPSGPLEVLFWYPGEDRIAIGNFENWFWKTTRAHHCAELNRILAASGTRQPFPASPTGDSWQWQESHGRFVADVQSLKSTLPPETADKLCVPELSVECRPLHANSSGARTTISAALVLFALFFVCVYLLPSLACEERENGVLLAQALSPATSFEIIAARLIFYPTIAVAFAAILGVLVRPQVLTQPFFWLTLIVLAFASLGIGMTIACIARTQRSASMTALCYMLVVSLGVLHCQQNQISAIPQLMVEFHGPRMLNAAMTNSVTVADYLELLYTAGLAIAWNAVATVCFRRFGWQ
jgi:hypothetical protein